jgi:hypothetical protein
VHFLRDTVFNAASGQVGAAIVHLAVCRFGLAEAREDNRRTPPSEY